jgi:hypothetical protein
MVLRVVYDLRNNSWVETDESWSQLQRSCCATVPLTHAIDIPFTRIEVQLQWVQIVYRYLDFPIITVPVITVIAIYRYFVVTKFVLSAPVTQSCRLTGWNDRYLMRCTVDKWTHHCTLLQEKAQCMFCKGTVLFGFSLHKKTNISPLSELVRSCSTLLYSYMR